LRLLIYDSLVDIYILALDEGVRRLVIIIEVLIGAVNPIGYISDDGNVR
jgi:hypothetical protein